MNVGDIHVVDGTVVEEMSAFPASTLEAIAEVAEAVVNTAVEPDMRSPVAYVEKKRGAAPTPPARSPQEARLRCQYPRARHPIVAVRAVSPVTGRPDVTLGGARWLFVHGKCRRANMDRYANADLRRRRGGQRHQHHNCDEQRTEQQQRNASITHRVFSSPAEFSSPQVGYDFKSPTSVLHK